MDEVSVGDKAVAFSCLKQVISEVVPEGLEPYSEFNPDEDIDMFSSSSGVLKRMVVSAPITACANKVLIETKRKMQRIWEDKE